MNIKRVLIGFLIILSSLSISICPPALAALPPGNAIKSPYALLRNALPIEQKELRELQHNLEDTSDLVRGGRWPAINKAASSSLFLLNRKKQGILSSIPQGNRDKGENILISLKDDLKDLEEASSEKNKEKFIQIRRVSLEKIGELESLLLTDEFPYNIPSEFDDLPRLLGRAEVLIETSKGPMNAIIDGYNAPLTGGAFIDLALKGFYDDLPFNRAEDFYILQTGDPKGDAIGYIDPNTNEERHVPLEIRVPGKLDTVYNKSFEEIGIYTEVPVLPFATLGTLGWAHSGEALDDGSSQFFFFLYEAELNPAGRNLIDGRNAAFGYVVEGFEVLEELGVKDKIKSIKVLSGANLLKDHA